MKIQYQNKEAIDLQPGVPAKNKVTDSDMNEIKNVVNTNADTLDDVNETVTNFVNDVDNRLGDVEEETVNLKSNVEDLETNTYTKSETDDLIESVSNSIPTKTSELINDSSFVNETQLNTVVNNEKILRENADNNLQSQIDGIVASSDVVDIVGTYQELQNYDTTKLGDNDIIKVLDDSTHNNATSYYRYKKAQNTWQYIGSEGPYYTKSETDILLNGKVNVVSGKGLSTNDFTDNDLTKLNGIEANAEVNKINNIQVNGTTQPINNKTVNIEVPTKTSDLTNDSDFTTKAYVDDLVGDIETLLYNINRGSGV